LDILANALWLMISGLQIIVKRTGLQIISKRTIFASLILISAITKSIGTNLRIKL